MLGLYQRILKSVRKKSPYFYDKTVKGAICMPLSSCNVIVDASRRERVSHGTAAYPIACYGYTDLSRSEVPWHWHEAWEAIVVLSGRCAVAAGKEKFVLKSGEGIFINSGVLHGCWNRGRPGCQFHSLVFHPRLVGGGMDSVFYQNYVQPLSENRGLECLRLSPEVAWQREAMEAIENAWQANVRETEGYEFVTRNRLSELTLLLHQHVPGETGQSGAKARRDEERIKRMLQYIHDNFAGELRVGDIAGAAAISESECLRCFRAAIATTPIQYVRQYRIQRAAWLLVNTQQSIAEIGGQCGFPDISYFTKTFREQKGCTPGQYRRGVRGED